MSIRTFRYVRWDCLPDYLALGWLPVADLGPIHGRWSILSRWRQRAKVDRRPKVAGGLLPLVRMRRGGILVFAAAPLSHDRRKPRP
jgi:hypothetical protein